MGYHVEKPGNDVEMKAMYGFDFESKNLTDPLILDTAGATATLNAICATSKHPEAAMQVLELLNTDAESLQPALPRHPGRALGLGRRSQPRS